MGLYERELEKEGKVVVWVTERRNKNGSHRCVTGLVEHKDKQRPLEVWETPFIPRTESLGDVRETLCTSLAGWSCFGAFEIRPEKLLEKEVLLKDPLPEELRKRLEEEVALRCL